jgi:hypothetical protein
MCLLIYKPANHDVPEEWLENGFYANPDGAGLAWVTRKGKLAYWRSTSQDFDKFFKAYEPVRDSAMLIHFRLSTGGGVTKANCHPFALGERMALAHNGVLSCTSATFRQSDTSVLVDMIKCFMGERLDDLIGDNALAARFEKLIGANNKIAVLRGDGAYRIFNEGAGHWRDGVWYSNNGYQFDPYPIRVSSSLGDYADDWGDDGNGWMKAGEAGDGAYYRFLRDAEDSSPSPSAEFTEAEKRIIHRYENGAEKIIGFVSPANDAAKKTAASGNNPWGPAPKGWLNRERAKGRG